MEQYVKKPAAVQVFALNGATDIILRKDIASEKITDEEGNKQTVWNCDERQIRVAFAVTEEEKSRRTSIRGGTISRRARLSL